LEDATVAIVVLTSRGTQICNLLLNSDDLPIRRPKRSYISDDTAG
jgi:hypothetical protein